MWKQVIGFGVLSLVVSAAPARADRGDVDAAIDAADTALEALESAAESEAVNARVRATIKAQLDILRGLYEEHKDSLLLRRLASGLASGSQALHSAAPERARALRAELRALVSANATNSMQGWYVYILLQEFVRAHEASGDLSQAERIEEEVLAVISGAELQELLRDGLAAAYATAHSHLVGRSEPKSRELLVLRMRDLATRSTTTERQRNHWSVILRNEILRLMALREQPATDRLQDELAALIARDDVTDVQLNNQARTWMLRANTHWRRGEAEQGDVWAGKLRAQVRNTEAAGQIAQPSLARLLKVETKRRLKLKKFSEAEALVVELVELNDAFPGLKKARQYLLGALGAQLYALERSQRHDDFVLALARVRTITQGPQASSADHASWAYAVSIAAWQRSVRHESVADLLVEFRKLTDRDLVDAGTFERLLQGLRVAHHGLRSKDVYSVEAEELLDEVRIQTLKDPRVSRAALAAALECAHKHFSEEGHSKRATTLLAELRGIASAVDADNSTKGHYHVAVVEAIRCITKGKRAGDADALLSELREQSKADGAPATARGRLVHALSWQQAKALRSSDTQGDSFLDEAREICARHKTSAKTRSWLAYMLFGGNLSAHKASDLLRARTLLSELNHEANREDADPYTHLQFANALCNGIRFAGKRQDFESDFGLSEQLHTLADSRHGSAEIRALLAPTMQSRHAVLVKASKYADAFVVLGQLRTLASRSSATQAERDALAGALAYEVTSVFKRGGQPQEAQRVTAELWRVATSSTATEKTRDELAVGIAEIHRAALERASGSDENELADITLSEMQRLALREGATDAQRDHYATMLRAQNAYHIGASQDNRAIELLSRLESLAVDPKRSSEVQRDNWKTSLKQQLTRDKAVAGAALSSFKTFARAADFPVVDRHKLLAHAVELAYANRRDGADDAYDVLHDLGLGEHATAAGRTVHALWLVGAIRRARHAKAQTLTKRIEADLRKAIATGVGRKIVTAMKTALEDTED